MKALERWPGDLSLPYSSASNPPTLARTNSLAHSGAHTPSPAHQRSSNSSPSLSRQRALSHGLYIPSASDVSTYRNALKRSVRALHVTWPDPSIRARISGRGRPLAPFNTSRSRRSQVFLFICTISHKETASLA